MADTMENKSEIEAMEEFANQMWERYFKPRASEELLGHSLDGYKAKVKVNNDDGTLTVTRPFDGCEQTLKCPPALAETAQPGDQVLVVNLGDASNAFILCGTDLTGFGDGVGIGVDSLGDIAQLTVDRLSTSERVKKYFLQDTTPDYFLRIQDGYIQFITGTYSSSTPVQATDRYGNNLYWNANPTNHTQDGEPTDANGNRIYSTTRATEWPVYTYTYDDSVLGSIAFRVPSGQSSTNGLDFIFTDSNNNESGISMNSTGYMDLYGLRKPTTLDFSGWNSGYFSEELDGQQTASWLVDFDSQGRPILFTDGEGHETAVVW